MASIKLSVALAIVAAPTSQPVQALILVILLVVDLYQLTRPQDELDTDQGLPPVTSESHQNLEPAPTTPAATRPPLKRRNCFVLGPNGVTSEPLSPDWEARWSSTSSDSEGCETAPEDAAPARTMAETRAPAHFEERLRAHQESVSSETSACASSPAAQRQLTNAQIRDLSDDDDENCFFNEEEEDEAEMLKRRNIKMREEGVRVRVNYSQLSYLKPAPAPRSEPAFGNESVPLASANMPPLSCSSPSSATSTTPLQSGLLSPAPTPCGGIPSTGITTPDRHQASPASVLPTSGRAAAALDRIDEQLLAIPADATSRRLLRDGRASLYRSKTLSRSVVAFAGVGGSSSGRQTPSPVEGGVQYSKSEGVWYPSEMMD